jgi:hypothetical protein
MKCWICNNEGNSTEHKFKASDIKRFHGKSFKEKVILNIADKTICLQGPNSAHVKHKHPICQNCNNNVTSAHDKAYDIFVTTIILDCISSLESGQIDLLKIFGENWKEQMRNLYKYYAKQIGSRIVDNIGTYYPQSLKNFILLDAKIQTFKLKIILKVGMAVLDHYISDKNSKPLGYLFNGSTFSYIYENRTYFHGWSSYSWLTIHWLYCEDGLDQNQLQFDDPILQVEVQKMNITERIEKDSLLDWFEFYGLTKLEDRIKFIENMINNSI